MKNEVAVLTANDLNAAGINSNLNSNDLIEVIANDIYDKYLDAVTDFIEKGEKLKDKYYDLLTPEISKMKKALSVYFKDENSVEMVDEDDYISEEFNGIFASFGTADGYWPSISMTTLIVKEKDRGSFVESKYRSYSLPVMKDKNCKVVLKLQTGNKSNSKEVKVGGIVGSIETSTKKTFQQVINTTTVRFKVFANEVAEYNKDATRILAFLPKNGLLSVERFTREARVKMNKKIISAQSPEFKNKISELFNISL